MVDNVWQAEKVGIESMVGGRKRKTSRKSVEEWGRVAGFGLYWSYRMASVYEGWYPSWIAVDCGGLRL